MKHNHNRKNGRNGASKPVPVRLEFIHPSAAQVNVAGSFNEWQPGIEALQSPGDGRWVCERTLAPGTYEYCLVVDGVWIADPKAETSVTNPFGGRNSVLTVVQPAVGKQNGKGDPRE